MKLKAFANGLLQQAELPGDGDVFIASRVGEGDWARVSGVGLVHEGRYAMYPLVDDSPSRALCGHAKIRSFSPTHSTSFCLAASRRTDNETN